MTNQALPPLVLVFQNLPVLLVAFTNFDVQEVIIPPVHYFAELASFLTDKISDIYVYEKSPFF